MELGLIDKKLDENIAFIEFFNVLLYFLWKIFLFSLLSKQQLAVLRKINSVKKVEKIFLI